MGLAQAEALIVFLNGAIEFIDVTAAAACCWMGSMNTTSSYRIATTPNLNAHPRGNAGTARRRARLVQTALLVAIGLCLAGCEKAAEPGTPKAENKAASVTTQSIAGVYKLVSIDGKKVPASIKHEGTPIELRSGEFRIQSDGTCASKMVFVPPSGTEATRDVSATYTLTGNRLDMTWKGAGTTVGSIEGSTFTMENEGMKLVFSK